MTTYVPNTFATPNAIIDVLMPLLTDSEFRVLMFITRQILGWEKSRVTNRARISQSVMEKGYTYQDKQGNEQYVPGCGLSKNPIRDALKSLQKYRIIEAIGEPTNDGQEWEFILLTKDNPDIAGLKLRLSNKSNKSKKQTEKARKNNPKLQGGISSTNTPKGGELTNTGGISSTNSRGISSTNTNETNKETNKETHTLADEPQPVAELPIAQQEIKSVDTDKLSTDEHNEFLAVLNQHFNLHGSRIWLVYHQLRGTSKPDGRNKDRYESSQLFRDKPVTLSELIGFVKWYRQECKGCDLPISAATLEDWFGKYRTATDKPKVITQFIADGTTTRPTASDGVVVFEKKDSA